MNRQTPVFRSEKQQTYFIRGEKFTSEEILNLVKEVESLKNELEELKALKLKLQLRLLDRTAQMDEQDAQLQMWKDFYKDMKSKLKPVIIEWNLLRNKVWWKRSLYHNLLW